MNDKKLIIDRIEGDIAVCETGGEMTEIPVSRLPRGVKEGSVLSVCGKDYRLEQEETAQRRVDIAELQRRAFGKK